MLRKINAKISGGGGNAKIARKKKYGREIVNYYIIKLLHWILRKFLFAKRIFEKFREKICKIRMKIFVFFRKRFCLLETLPAIPPCGAHFNTISYMF